MPECLKILIGKTALKQTNKNKHIKQKLNYHTDTEGLVSCSFTLTRTTRAQICVVLDDFYTNQHHTKLKALVLCSLKSTIPCSKCFCLVAPARSPGCSRSCGGRWWGSHQASPCWQYCEEPTSGHSGRLQTTGGRQHSADRSSMLEKTGRFIQLFVCLFFTYL